MLAVFIFVFCVDRNEAVLKDFEAKALANIEGGLEAPPNMRVTALHHSNPNPNPNPN
jgi:hypothetical protein